MTTTEKDSSEQACRDTPYRLSVDDMSCQHCLASVEKAALSVSGVLSASVNLDESYVEVVGGLPHEVVEAITAAGYAAKPQAKIPDSCPISEAVPESAPEEIADTSSVKNSYQIKISDMTCASCVATVEKAILSVTGVTEGVVNLIEKTAWVVGGDQQAVVDAIIDQGYAAELVPEKKTTADSYQVNIADMTCTSCVATIEKAIKAVAGVTGATVNLIEKKALVTGGDPEQVVNAVIDQGYGASLVEVDIVEDHLNLLFEGQRNDMLEILLHALASDVHMSWPTATLITHLHPAELLLKLKDAGFTATLEEQFEDPYKTQTEEASREVSLSWQRAILAGSVGALLMAGEMSGLFPELSSEGGQVFWAMMALLCLFTILINQAATEAAQRIEAM